jgi:hypothetical protein
MPESPTPAQPPALIVYCAADLLWATKIKSTADALGIPCRPVRDLAMLEARLSDSNVVAALVDLDAGDPARQIITRLKAQPATGADPIRVLVFGPHVDADGLRWAKSAGADSVLARGALHSNLPAILQSLAQRSAVADQLTD